MFNTFNAFQSSKDEREQHKNTVLELCSFRIYPCAPYGGSEEILSALGYLNPTFLMGAGIWPGAIHTYVG